MDSSKSVKGSFYVFAFLFTVLLALLLLFVSALLPQSLIINNISQSITGLNTEGCHPYTFDLQESASLDTYTDIQMLRATATTHKDNIGSVLTNDFHYYHSAPSPMDELEYYTLGMQPDSVGHYVRYWMGFRTLLRLGLVFLNYFQIRRYLGFAFFCLLFALVFRIAKHTDTKLAYLFALSIILVRPQVIVSSLQFSCCFYIAFLSMLLVPWLYRNPKWEALFFMEVGMITMYFDFYTVPLVTFGYPVVYLLVLQAMNNQKITAKRICVLLLAWLLGWGLMWVAKLTLTTVFTQVNGFENGFSSFLGRIGVVKDAELEEYYSIPLALSTLLRVIFSDFEGAVIYMLGVIVCVGAVIYQARRNQVSLSEFVKHKNILLVALFPMAWFIITAQPIAIHAFFQYRSIAVIYWSVSAYLFVVLRNSKNGNAVKIV